MTPEDEISYLIDGYLNGTLGKEEKDQFELELSKNSALQTKLEMTRLARMALLRNKLREAREISSAIDTNAKQTAKVKRIAIGAGLALLLAGGIAAYLYMDKNELPVKTENPPVLQQAVKRQIQFQPTYRLPPHLLFLK